MNLLYAWLCSLLLLLGFFVWQAYGSRQAASRLRNNQDWMGLLLICMLLVAVVNFVLLFFYLLPRR